MTATPPPPQPPRRQPTPPPPWTHKKFQSKISIYLAFDLANQNSKPKIKPKNKKPNQQVQFTWQKTKKKKKTQMKSQRKPRWNPMIAPSEPTPFSLLISLSHLSLRLWLGASPPPLIENPLKYCWFFAFAGVIPEMGGRTNLCGCARGRGRWVSGCRQLLLGQWLSSAAARACAVAGGSYSLGYCRRWLGFDFFPLSLSLSLWVFLFFFFILRKKLWDFTSGRTVENKFFNLVLVNFSSHV